MPDKFKRLLRPHRGPFFPRPPSRRERAARPRPASGAFAAPLGPRSPSHPPGRAGLPTLPVEIRREVLTHKPPRTNVGAPTRGRAHPCVGSGWNVCKEAKELIGSMRSCAQVKVPTEHDRMDTDRPYATKVFYDTGVNHGEIRTNGATAQNPSAKQRMHFLRRHREFDRRAPRSVLTWRADRTSQRFVCRLRRDYEETGTTRCKGPFINTAQHWWSAD